VVEHTVQERVLIEKNISDTLKQIKDVEAAEPVIIKEEAAPPKPKPARPVSSLYEITIEPQKKIIPGRPGKEYVPVKERQPRILEISRHSEQVETSANSSQPEPLVSLPVQNTEITLPPGSVRTMGGHETDIVPLKPEVKFEPAAEAAETVPVVYEDISEEDIAPVPQISPEATDVLHIPQPETEEPTINSFEEMVETRAEPEKLVTLEIVQSLVTDGEQQVEETFVQLAQILEEQIEEPGSEIQEIKQIIQEISEELEVVIAQAEQDEARPELTPGLKEKIVVLLRVLGYKEPEQALEQLLEKYDLDFVIEALQYLRQLTDSGQRQEFSRAAQDAPVSSRRQCPLHQIMAAFLLTKSIFYSLSN
jgi:hypothetical protein